MSQDLITTYLSDNTQNITILDTLAEQYHRPTTASTARDAAKKFAEHIVNGDYGDKKEFIILFETNNPYIERQTIATQRQVNEVLNEYELASKGYQIKVEGLGSKSNQGVATIHSELAALVAEKWKDAPEYQSKNTPQKRAIEDLLFQTRDHSEVAPLELDISEISISGSWLQDIFDEYLP